MGRRKRKADKDADLTFELLDEHLIGEYGTEITLLLGVLGQIDYDLAQAIVTDESKFSDFDLSDEELDELSTEVGVNINHDDLLTTIAQKMRGED
jgi:hypothetical protein